MAATWTDKSAAPYVYDQVWATEDASELSENCRYIRDVFDLRHVLSTGLHDDRLIPRIQGVVKYTGTFGGGGAWAVENGAGFTVANLGPDVDGRGQLTFDVAMTVSTYGPACSPRVAATTADSADSPTGAIWTIEPYDRQTTGFRFRAESCPQSATVAWTLGSAGCKFGVICFGQV